MWIWQQENWPDFHWNDAALAEKLRSARFNQGVLLGKTSLQSDDDQHRILDTLLANILHSNAIEGEKLNAFSVRSSLANKLGITELEPYPTSSKTDGLAEIMLDAISNLDDELTLDRILYWHGCLFTDNALLTSIDAALLTPIKGGTLRGQEPMQVVSGRIDRPTLHFEAPPRAGLDAQLAQFIKWFNQSRLDPSLDPLLRAAITHLWFVTLHPLEDGNGRIARLLTDLALAQAEQQSIRFYAMSVAILEKRRAYYQILEQTQKGSLDITDWLDWFITTLNQAFTTVLNDVEKTTHKTLFWRRVNQTKLTTEQVKVLNRLLDGDFEHGINASQYQKIAKVSSATATRHLTALLNSGCLVKTGAGGRSTRYKINHVRSSMRGN